MHKGRRNSKFSLELLGLKACLSEGLAKEVLRSVTSSVSSVTCNRKNHLSILDLSREDFLETIGHGEELLPSLVIKQIGLELGEIVSGLSKQVVVGLNELGVGSIMALFSDGSFMK